MKNKSLREERIHGEPGFSVSCFDGSFSEESVLLAPLHYHPEFELIAAKEGHITVRLEKLEFVLNAGDGLLVPSAKLHTLLGEAGEKKAFLAVVFSEKFLAQEEERISVKYLQRVLRGELLLPVRLPDGCGRKIVDIGKHFQEREIGYELSVKAEILTILAKAMELSEERTTAGSRFPHQEVKKVLNYVEHHYSQEISLQELAAIAGMSREHLCRTFSEIASISPMAYVNRFRVKKSLEYLRDTDRTMQEISDLCGFGSAGYFNRLFRRYTGQTPGQYRKNAAIEEMNLGI